MGKRFFLFSNYAVYDGLYVAYAFFCSSYLAEQDILVSNSSGETKTVLYGGDSFSNNIFY